MSDAISQSFGAKFLGSAENFYDYGVHLLFNDWWMEAPEDAIDKYVRAIEDHPEQSELAREGWYAEPLSLAALEPFPCGTLGHAYLRFMVENDLMEKLAVGYRTMHDQLGADGVLDRMPPILEYKVLRGYQTHGLHHVLTGYPATPLGELAIQSFQLAQTPFPYAGMWIAVVTAHMTFIDPHLITPAMDAIAHGWSAGRRAKSIQFVKFEEMLGRNLEEIRNEYLLDEPSAALFQTPKHKTPRILAPAAR